MLMVIMMKTLMTVMHDHDDNFHKDDGDDDFDEDDSDNGDDSDDGDICR